jgi:nicotinamidase-related amidase
VRELPIPPHFDPARVGEIWRVPYQDRATEARVWADEHDVSPSASDGFRIGLVCVDVQNTFCIPGYELFVAGRSGTAAVDDNRRLAEFVYRNLGTITEIVPTLDTHHPTQIFHAVFLVDAEGRHPEPYTLVTPGDVESGRWRVNAAAAESVGVDPEYAQRHLLHYTRALAARGKYDLTIWPYHAMLGGIGHALVPAIEEAIFFHSIARSSQPRFEVKGEEPLTEHYSMLGPEVRVGPGGRAIGTANVALIRRALVRRRRHRRAGEEPLRRVDDRRSARGRRGAEARACAAHLPARGLHLAGGRARDGLHRRGRRGVRALRRRRHAHRPLDRPDRDLARPAGARQVTRSRRGFGR